MARTPRFTIAVALLLACVAGGCNRYSRITTQSGEEVRILVTGSDASSVQGLERSGAVVTVPRADIAQVTYPGNVATKIFGAMFGGGLGLAGLGGLLLLLPEGEPEGGHIAGGVLLVTGGAVALAGVGPLLWYLLEARTARGLVEGGAAIDAGAVLIDVAPGVAAQPGGASGSVAVRLRW